MIRSYGAARRVPERAVCGDHRHLAVAGVGQCGAGLDSDLGVDLDADHLLEPEPVREQGSVVAGASADLAYPLPRLRIQRGQHHCHDDRRRCRTARHPSGEIRSGRATVIDLGDHSLIAVGQLQPPIRIVGAAQRQQHRTVAVIVDPHGVREVAVPGHRRQRWPPRCPARLPLGKIGVRR